MSQQQAIQFVYNMWEMWVSRRGPDEGMRWEPRNVARIKASMLQDLRWRRDKAQYAGVVREIRGQLSKLGKAVKVLQ